MSGTLDPPVRMLCLWWPDWPVEVARRRDGALAGVPVVVLERGLVRSASAEARVEGVRSGLRRRDAEARCPGVVTMEADPGAEGQAFERVAEAMEALTPRVAVERPGVLLLPTRGPSRARGGDVALAEAALAAVRAAGDVGEGAPFPARVGVADGVFAARLAARGADAGSTLVVPQGSSAAFLAPWPVGVLGAPALADLLVRLGVPTLGAFAALPPSAVVSRFGSEGRVAHRRARGLDEEHQGWRIPPPELAEAHEFDPPAERLDVVAFVAKALADRLHGALVGRGLACTQVLVEAECGSGEIRSRSWRGESPLGAGELAERVRWQLEAWMAGAGRGEDPFPEGLARLRLVPEEVVTAGGRQLGLWGSSGGADERAGRALARLQGLFGPEAVVTVTLEGGRTPAEQGRWSTWGGGQTPSGQTPSGQTPSGQTPSGQTRRGPGPVDGRAPWPGAVPPPAPALVFDPGLPAELLDASGAPVTVSARGEPSATPALLRGRGIPGGGGPVEAWAGPWPHDLRWWDRAVRKRRALWQVMAGGVAHLVATEGRRASVEATYD